MGNQASDQHQIHIYTLKDEDEAQERVTQRHNVIGSLYLSSLVRLCIIFELPKPTLPYYIMPRSTNTCVIKTYGPAWVAGWLGGWLCQVEDEYRYSSVAVKEQERRESWARASLRLVRKWCCVYVVACELEVQ